MIRKRRLQNWPDNIRQQKKARFIINNMSKKNLPSISEESDSPLSESTDDEYEDDQFLRTDIDVSNPIVMIKLPPLNNEGLSDSEDEATTQYFYKNMPDDKEKLVEDDYKYLPSFRMLESKKGQFLHVVKEYNLALLLVNKSIFHL